MDRIFNKNPDIVFRKIAEEYILVPIKNNVGDMESIYTLKNEVAACIWELIDGKKKLKEIRDIILEKFEVTSQQAEDDLIQFINQLKEIDGIRGTK